MCLHYVPCLGSAKGFGFGQSGFPVKCPCESCGGAVALVVNCIFYPLKGYKELGDVDK